MELDNKFLDDIKIAGADELDASVPLKWLYNVFNKATASFIEEQTWLDFINKLIEEDRDSEYPSVRAEFICTKDNVTITQEMKLQEFMNEHDQKSYMVAICLYTYNPNGIYRKLGRALVDLKHENLIIYETFISQLAVFMKYYRIEYKHIHGKDFNLYRGTKQTDLSLFKDGTILQVRNFVSTSFDLATAVKYAFNSRENYYFPLLKIKFQDGANFPAVNLAKYSAAPEKEEEVLIEPFATMEIGETKEYKLENGKAIDDDGLFENITFQETATVIKVISVTLLPVESTKKPTVNFVASYGN